MKSVAFGFFVASFAVFSQTTLGASAVVCEDAGNIPQASAELNGKINAATIRGSVLDSLGNNRVLTLNAPFEISSPSMLLEGRHYRMCVTVKELDSK